VEGSIAVVVGEVEAGHAVSMSGLSVDGCFGGRGGF
jgi:hypothetical protein